MIAIFQLYTGFLFIALVAAAIISSLLRRPEFEL